MTLTYDARCACDSNDYQYDAFAVCASKLPAAPEPDQSQPEQAGMCTRRPILPATAEKLYSETDLSATGSHALAFVRTFRSSWSVNPARSLPSEPGLGQAWSHNHAVSLQRELPTGSKPAAIRITFGDGSTSVFAYNAGTARWVPADSASSVVATASPVPGYLFTRAMDDSRWQFDQSGKLLSATQRNGWVMRYTYSDASTAAAISPRANLLIAVVNQFGQSLQFSYNGLGLLSTATSSDGQVFRFAFDASQRLASISYPDNTSKTYVYENSAFPKSVTGIVDERGVRLSTVVYDAQGRAVESGYAGGADRYTVTYDASSSAISTASVTDPLGTTRAYSYNRNLGKLSVTGSSLPSEIGVNDAASRVQNTAGLIDSETDFLGVQTMYTWDINRRLPLSTTKAANRPQAQTTSTQWHPTFRLPVVVTEPGRTTAFTYDAAGNKLSETVTDIATGQTRTWAWTYNPQGLVATRTDPRGNTSQFTYDTAGNLAIAKNPLGQETRYTYDAAGRVLSETVPDNVVTTITYDVRGRVLTTTVGNEVTAYTYTPTGQINSAVLPGGYAVNYTYDAAQRLVAATDNRGNTISYTLDAMGNRVREEVKDAGGTISRLTTRTINNLNRVAAMGGAAGQTTQYGFDANGEPIQSTDPLNQTTRQTLDPLRRPVGTTFADNTTATQAWNPLDQLTQVTDPKGVATQYTRNAFGEVIAESSPDIGTITYTRDSAGNITSSTDAKGQVTQITRDALARPTQVSLADGKAQQITYNSVGNLVQIADSSGSTSFTRDSLSRIRNKIQVVADKPFSPSQYRVGYGYRAGGGVTNITYPSGLGVSYMRNASDQITGVMLSRQVLHLMPGPQPGQYVVVKMWVNSNLLGNLTYSALGRVKSGQMYCWSSNSTYSTPCGTINYTFDTDGRTQQSTFGSYAYDAASRITSVTQQLATTAGTVPVTWSAGYDNRNSLIDFNRAGMISHYSFDANSNRLSAATVTASASDLESGFDQPTDRQNTSQQTTAIAPTSNRLLGFTQTLATRQGEATLSSTTSQINYTVDAAGNLTSDGLRQFDYDATNRLSQVKISQSPEASKITYLHNALGQRVFKSEPQVAQTAPNAATLGTGFVDWLKANFGWLFAQAQTNATLGQSFVYDDAVLGNTPVLLGEYGNGSATPAGRVEYIWLPLEDGSTLPIGVVINDRVYTIHADHLNTPRRVTDDSNQVVWQWPYSAFGDNKPTGILKATPNAAVPGGMQLQATRPAITLNLRYPGQYFDEESNLNYNYFRSYQASQGRYTQGDPIGLAGGLNRFAYVGGNPLTLTDPTGLAWVYQQSTGNLYHQPGSNPANMTLISSGGYAGHGSGVNSPLREIVSNVGPLPQGSYTIGPQQTIVTGRGTVLPAAMRLIPDADNWMFNRAGFIIHGGNMQTKTSSEGCIIQPVNIRNQIGNSGDKRLKVIP